MPNSESAVSEMTIYEMQGMPAPTTDESTTFRECLEAAAIAAAYAAGELALAMLDAKEQGQPFQPAPALIDDFKQSIVSLDKSWRTYIRGGQKGAAAVVHNMISAYWGSDFARAIEVALEGYRRA